MKTRPHLSITLLCLILLTNCNDQTNEVAEVAEVTVDIAETSQTLADIAKELPSPERNNKILDFITDSDQVC